MKKVVITGMGAVTPLGSSIEQTWENLTQKKSGIGPVTRFDASSLPSRIAGELKGFSPEDYISKKDKLTKSHFFVSSELTKSSIPTFFIKLESSV